LRQAHLTQPAIAPQDANPQHVPLFTVAALLAASSTTIGELAECLVTLMHLTVSRTIAH